MPYRFAIVGCGNISRRHALAIRDFGNLAAVCDPLFSRAEQLAHETGARAYPGMNEMLSAEKPDIVVICSPNGDHAGHAIQALRAGCHVICEKPIAIRSADGEEMIKEADIAGKKLFVVKQNRYNLPVMITRSLLLQDKLGKISGFQVNCFWNRNVGYYNKEAWRGTLESDGGTLFTQFSHFIDLLIWFLGEPARIDGMRSNSLHQGVVEFEDQGVATIVMENGAIGTLHYTLNAYGSNMEGSLTLFGSGGSLKIGGPYLDRMEHFQVEGEDYQQLVKGLDAQTFPSTHHQVYHNVILSLNEPENFAVDAAEALKSVKMIERIYAASPLMDGKTNDRGR